MKIGKSFDPTKFFDKTVNTSDDVTEGTTKLFYPSGDKTKVSYLPAGAISYLEIEKVTENPPTGTEGWVIHNTTNGKFFLWKTNAWVEVLFSMEEITP